MIKPMLLVAVVVVTTLMVVVLAVALLLNRRAEQVELASDIPGLNLAPADGLQVWEHRASGRPTTYSRAYATMLDEAGVEAFYDAALTGLGYRRIDSARPADEQGPRTLAEYERDGIRYRVAVIDPPHVVSGTRVTDEWRLVVYTVVDAEGSR